MKPRFLVQPTLLSPTSIKLGRLVCSPLSPHQDYLDPPAPTPPETTSQTQSNFTSHLSTTTSTKLLTRLTALIAASRTVSTSTDITLTAAKGTTYTLLNSGEWFRAACEAPEVRDWFQNAVVTDNKAYLVVGYHTLTDSHFVKREAGAEALAGGVSVDSGVLAPVMVGARAEAGVVRGNEWGGRMEWEEGGEGVWAVQYRKVRFRWFSSRKIEKGVLEKGNRWKVCWSGAGLRGDEEEEEKEEEEEGSSGEEEVDSEEEEEEDEDDMLEVDVDEETDSDDELGDGEGEWIF